MSAHRLQALVAPTSVAVVGATPRAGAVGNEVLVNLLKGEFAGTLSAINPNYPDVLGIPCYPSLTDLPQAPQHVIFAVGDRHIEAALDVAIALDIPAATIYSSLVLTEDPDLQQRITAKVQAAGMLLAGANGMGIYNFREHFWGCGFDTRDHGHPGNVVLLSQSGAGMSGILDCEERIDFLFAASTGQELVVGIEDYLDYVLDLPETRVVGLFLETSRQPDKFLACLRKASEKRIPVVAVKVGKTDLAARLAVSHSGALAGDDASYQAVFDRYGVQRVNDMDELATALILFARCGVLGEGGLVSLHDSGGERQLLIDLAQREGVALAELSADSCKALQAALDPGLPALNPLDAWGAGGPDADSVMADCLAHMMQDPAAALGVVVHDRAPGGTLYPAYIEYLEHACERSGKPACLVASRQGTGSDALVTAATRRGFPVLDGVSQFLVGVRALQNYRDFLAQAQPVAEALSPLITESLRGQLRDAGISGALGEYLSSALLGECGITMNDSVLVQSDEDLAGILPMLHYPVVLKTAVPGIEHKSDVGGVVLSIDSASALQDAYRDMTARLGPQVMVAPMIEAPGVEMILGMHRDAQFGPMVVMGVGGVHAELLRDVVVLPAPFAASVAEQALQSLQLYPLLQGARGSEPVDVAAFCEMAARLSALAEALRDEISEIDINPVQLGSWGVLGLDALVVIEPAAGVAR